MESGRTVPLLINCRFPSGSTLPFVVKLSGNQVTRTQLLHEAISSNIARLVGIPTPKVAAIYGIHDLADSLPIKLESLKDRLENSIVPAFGSQQERSFPQWSPSQAPQSGDRIACVEIFTFDALIANPDRRRENPNLHRSNGKLCLIDHEIAFSGISTPLIGGSKFCWEQGGLDWICNREVHALYPIARQNTNMLDEVKGSWNTLTRSNLEKIFETLPSEWMTGNEAFGRIQDYLFSLVDNMNAAFAEVERALSS